MPCVRGCWSVRGSGGIVRAMTDPILRAHGGTLDPPPGGLDGSASRGGGTPNADDSLLSCPPISPGEQTGPVDAELTTHPVAGQLLAAGPDPVTLAHPVRWNGEPTKSALRLLSLEARTPGFDLGDAVAVLGLMTDEGMTLTAACSALGLRRGTVLAWKRLVPAFRELLEEAERGLGGFQRDRAVALLDADAEPSAVQARMKLAVMYDRGLAAQAQGGGGSGEVVVQIQRFSEGGAAGEQVTVRTGGGHG